MNSPTDNADVLDGTIAADTIFGLGGNDTLNGGGGNDSLYGQAGDDTSFGGDGDDLIQSDIGNDTLDGGAGADRLYGEAGDDTSYGREGDDLIQSGDGADVLYGGAGADRLFGEAGNDLSYGEDGDDLIQSGLGNDTLYGGAGIDDLFAQEGDDQAFGGDGNDYIAGGAGNDTLDGGAGADDMYGEEGDDYYVVDNLADYVWDTDGANTGLVTVDFYKQATGVQWTLAPGVKALPYWIDALAFGGAQYFNSQRLLDAGTIKYAFPAQVLASWDAEDVAGFTPINAAQRAFIQKTLAYIETVINVKFQLVSDATQPGVLTFANNNQPDSAGYASGGVNFTKWGVFLSNSGTSAAGNAAPVDGEYAALVIIHEIGHALGLKHPHNDTVGDFSPGNPPYLPPEEDFTTYTQLSYNSFRADYVGEFRDFDIAALQYFYGPAQVAGSGRNQTGNTTYTLLTSQRNFIWDGGGIDTLDASAANARLVLSLETGVHSYFGAAANAFISAAGQVTINIGTLIENAFGTAFDDIISGNEAANILRGNAGNDELRGGLGNDTLDGGAGGDVAVYSATYAQASITRTAGGVIISSALDGTDTLTNIEYAVFDGVRHFLLVFEEPGAPRVANYAVGAGGWSSQDRFPRMAADVNGDGLADIVGFGQAGTLVALGQAGGTFAAPVTAVANFGVDQGWSSDNVFHREMADVNNDGRADIVGFGFAGVLVSLAQANGTFGAATLGSGNFNPANGWSTQDGAARTLADVNGDGFADIVGFGAPGTFVALGTGTGSFGTATFALANFGIAQGWSSNNVFHREVGDVNGDGRADIVGFGAAGTLVALGQANGTFAAATLALGNFGTNQGWSTQDVFTRDLADVNGDGRDDIVGFGVAGTFVAYGQTNGTFSNAAFDLANFGRDQGWSSDNTFHRELADVNGDGLADIVGFGFGGVFVASAFDGLVL